MSQKIERVSNTERSLSLGNSNHSMTIVSNLDTNIQGAKQNKKSQTEMRFMWVVGLRYNSLTST